PEGPRMHVNEPFSNSRLTSSSACTLLAPVKTLDTSVTTNAFGAVSSPVAAGSGFAGSDIAGSRLGVVMSSFGDALSGCVHADASRNEASFVRAMPRHRQQPA